MEAQVINKFNIGDRVKKTYSNRTGEVVAYQVGAKNHQGDYYIFYTIKWDDDKNNQTLYNMENFLEKV